MPWNFQSIRVSLKLLYSDLLKLRFEYIVKPLSVIARFVLFMLSLFSFFTPRASCECPWSSFWASQVAYEHLSSLSDVPVHVQVCNSFVCPSVLYVCLAPLPCGVPLRILVCAPSPPTMCPSIFSFYAPQASLVYASSFMSLSCSLCAPLKLLLCAPEVPTVLDSWNIQSNTTFQGWGRGVACPTSVKAGIKVFENQLSTCRKPKMATRHKITIYS